MEKVILIINPLRILPELELLGLYEVIPLQETDETSHFNDIFEIDDTYQLRKLLKTSLRTSKIYI